MDSRAAVCAGGGRSRIFDWPSYKLSRAGSASTGESRVGGLTPNLTLPSVTGPRLRAPLRSSRGEAVASEVCEKRVLELDGVFEAELGRELATRDAPIGIHPREPQERTLGRPLCVALDRPFGDAAPATVRGYRRPRSRAVSIVPVAPRATGCSSQLAQDGSSSPRHICSRQRRTMAMSGKPVGRTARPTTLGGPAT